MAVYVWSALGVAIAVSAATAFYAVASGLRAWRSLRRFRRKISDSVGDVTRRAAGIERHLGEAGAAVARLDRASAELQESLATAQVLASAFGEFRATLSQVTGLVPSK